MTYSHCFHFHAKHTKTRLILSFLVQYKVSSFMTINYSKSLWINLFFALLLWFSGAPTICPAFANSSLEAEGHAAADFSGVADEGIFCSHDDYPCRFTQCSARSQQVISHRVFGPVSLLQKAQVEFLQRYLIKLLIIVLNVHSVGVSLQ